MINAGRVLIIPKGEWTNLESYEMLDLVTRGDIAYIARQASVGVDPATDTQLTYWQPFGTAAKIATTTTPGLVMPDGTTVTIDATGLISANIGISDIKNVTITSISNGQILQYNSSTQKWENKSLGSAASRNATSSITSGSTDLIESGAVNSLKQTLESRINNVSAQVSDNEDAYSSSKPYKVGELCIHDNKLYKCITACSAAAWSINSGCFAVDTLASVVSDLNSSSTWKNFCTDINLSTSTSNPTRIPNSFSELRVILKNDKVVYADHIFLKEEFPSTGTITYRTDGWAETTSSMTDTPIFLSSNGIAGFIRINQSQKTTLISMWYR